jgi:hypothetical protein
MRTLTMLQVPAGLIAALLAVASLAPAAQAQDLAPGFAAKINVPFTFETAMGQHFAPGIYSISMNDGKTMLIRGAKASGLVLTQLADDGLPATRGMAVFTHYGATNTFCALSGSLEIIAFSVADRRLNINCKLPPPKRRQQ